jgi:mRNA-degrading endonuclease RelE of RelBE toxin-antitoxin system
MPYNVTVFTFIETKLFTRVIDEYLSDDELAALQTHLAINPESGDVVKGSGGVRKLRWSAPGRGKRGGIRVIYYLKLKRGEIWLLTAYAKNVRDSIPGPVLKKIKDEIDGAS